MFLILEAMFFLRQFNKKKLLRSSCSWKLFSHISFKFGTFSYSVSHYICKRINESNILFFYKFRWTYTWRFIIYFCKNSSDYILIIFDFLSLCFFNIKFFAYKIKRTQFDIHICLFFIFVDLNKIDMFATANNNFGFSYINAMIMFI